MRYAAEAIVLIGTLSLGGCTAAEQEAIADLKLDDLLQQAQQRSAAVAVSVPIEESCAIVNQAQSLSREDYATLTQSFVSVPMRSISVDKLKEVAGSPYCQLPDGRRADGSTFERRAYKLAFDESGLLAVAFVDKSSVVGWGFLFQKRPTHDLNFQEMNNDSKI